MVRRTARTTPGGSPPPPGPAPRHVVSAACPPIIQMDKGSRRGGSARCELGRYSLVATPGAEYRSVVLRCAAWNACASNHETAWRRPTGRKKMCKTAGNMAGNVPVEPGTGAVRLLPPPPAPPSTESTIDMPPSCRYQREVSRRRQEVVE